MNTENKKLYRSRDDRKIAGICGGLAKCLNINVHLLRWAFVLTGQVTGPLYLLMWIYLDEEPVEQQEDLQPQQSNRAVPLQP